MRVEIPVYHFISKELENAFKLLGAEVIRGGIYGEKYGEVWQFPVRKHLQIISTGIDIFFTINSTAIDKDGRVLRLLKRKKAYIIDWFVDNPFNVLNPWCIKNSPLEKLKDYERLYILVIDSVLQDKLKKEGFKNVLYFPHCTEPNIFNYSNNISNSSYEYEVSFVGHPGLFLIQKANKVFKQLGINSKIEEVKEIFLKEEKEDFEKFISKYRLDKLTNNDIQIQELVRWYLSLSWRIEVLKEVETNFELHVWGPLEEWKEILKKACIHKEVSYYTELPKIYRKSKVNLNTTNLQFPAGFNQRVLDIICAGGVIITDYCKDLERFFNLQKEIVCFKKITEIPSLIEKYIISPPLPEEIKSLQDKVISCFNFTKRVKNLLKEIGI